MQSYNSRGTNSFPRRALLFQSDSTGNLELLSVESHAVQVDQQLVPVLTAGTLDTGRRKRTVSSVTGFLLTFSATGLVTLYRYSPALAMSCVREGHRGSLITEFL